MLRTEDIWDSDDEFGNDEQMEAEEYLQLCGLLPKPIRDIEGAEYIEKNGLKIGHSSVQGHRPTNEDAHLIDTEILGVHYLLENLIYLINYF